MKKKKRRRKIITCSPEWKKVVKRVGDLNAVNRLIRYAKKKWTPLSRGERAL